MVNLLSININGIRKGYKRRWIRGLVNDSRIQILCIQETKCNKIDQWLAYATVGRRLSCWSSSDSVGASGGIGTFWNPDYVEIIATEAERNFLMITGFLKSNKTEFSVINVYAPQEDNSKQILWDRIKHIINESPDRVWIVCGDFNEVRHPDERKGSVFSVSGARRFNDFIDGSALHEIPMGGRNYTWMSPNGAKFSKLDRILVSDKLLHLWPNACSTALPRIHSDHCPILFETKGRDYGPSPFRFFSSWLRDEGLDKLVKDYWDMDRPGLNVFCDNRQISRSKSQTVS